MLYFLALFLCIFATALLEIRWSGEAEDLTFCRIMHNCFTSSIKIHPTMATSMLLAWWSSFGLAATFTHVPSPQRFRCSDSKVSLSSLFLPISLVNPPSLVNSRLPALSSLFSLILLSLPCLPACLPSTLPAGVSLEEWWRNEQFWVIGGTSAHLAAVMQVGEGHRGKG